MVRPLAAVALPTLLPHKYTLHVGRRYFEDVRGDHLWWFE